MARIALFAERESVTGLFLIECCACDWYVDWLQSCDVARYHVGTRELAFSAVRMHAAAKRHGAPRVIRSEKP